MKSKNTQPLSSFERAKKRVEDIKGFYGHLAVYLIVNLVLLLSRSNFKFMLINDKVFDNADFLAWIDWNIFGTPIIWGVFLAFHAFNVFGKNPFLGKSREDRQMQKFLKEERFESDKYTSS